MRCVTLLAFVLVTACTAGTGSITQTPADDSSVPSAPAESGPRTIETTLEVGSDGSTKPLILTVPSGTGVDVTATGNSSDVIAVAELTLGDEIDRVGISRIPDPLLMSGGTILTDGQIDVLRRSPVLEPSS